MLPGCEKLAYDLTDLDQVVLFQKEFVNSAWGYHHNGFFIDTTGAVRVYDLPDSWNFPDSRGYISRDELHENLQMASVSECTVDKNELLLYYNLLFKAQTGTLSEPEQRMFDAGIVLYTGYIYDERRARYRQVLLRQEGDWYLENRSRDAKRIY